MLNALVSVRNATAASRKLMIWSRSIDRLQLSSLTTDDLHSSVSVGRRSHSRQVSRVAGSISDGVFSRYIDRSDEAVTSARDIDDEPIPVLSVAQHATQSGNMDREVGRFDEKIRPDLCHQFLLADQFAGAIKQDDQDFQSAASNWYWLVTLEQKKLGRKQPKPSECKLVWRGAGWIGSLLEERLVRMRASNVTARRGPRFAMR